MRTFVTQAGAPYISTEANCARTAKTLVEAFPQKRFYGFIGKGHAECRRTRLWQVPVCLREIGKGNKGELRGA